MNARKTFAMVLSASALLLGGQMAHGTLACTASAYRQCLTDSNGVNILIQFNNGQSWTGMDFGSFYGFIEIPPQTTGFAEVLPCPIKGTFTLDQVDANPRYAWFTVYIESGCYCGDGANPAFRTAVLRIDRLTGKATDISDLAAHGLGCDGQTRVMRGQIGPYPSAVSPYPQETPDWLDGPTPTQTNPWLLP